MAVGRGTARCLPHPDAGLGLPPRLQRTRPGGVGETPPPPQCSGAVRVGWRIPPPAPCGVGEGSPPSCIGRALGCAFPRYSGRSHVGAGGALPPCCCQCPRAGASVGLCPALEPVGAWLPPPRRAREGEVALALPHPTWKCGARLWPSCPRHTFPSPDSTTSNGPSTSVKPETMAVPLPSRHFLSQGC